MKLRTMLAVSALLGAALPVVARPGPGQPRRIAFVRAGNVGEWTQTLRPRPPNGEAWIVEIGAAGGRSYLFRATSRTGTSNPAP
jgi:hypothetical protein